MARFRYKAEDRMGRPVSAERTAEDEQALERELDREGLRLLSAVRLGPAGGALDGDESSRLLADVANLAAAGAPMPSGLRALAAELPRRRLRAVMLGLADRLEAGRSLDEAVLELRDRLPANVAGLLLAGMASGRPAELLGDFAERAEVFASLRRRLRLAFVYPLILLGYSGVLAVFLSKWVIARYAEMFRDFGMQLPWVTWLAVQFGEGVDRFGVGVLLALPLGAASCWLIARLLVGREARRRWLLRVPLLGSVVRGLALAEFCYDLGLLVDARLPLPEALPLAADCTGDALLEAAGRRASTAVAGGSDLARALADTGAFPRGLAEVVLWAQDRTSLGAALRLAGDLFQADAQARGTALANVVAAVTLIGVLWGVILITVALFYPLVTLITALA